MMKRNRLCNLFVLVVVFLCCLAQCAAAQDIAWKIVTDVAAKAARDGRFADAEEAYDRALRLVRESAVPTSPDVATALNNLANFYHSQGQDEKAEPLLVEALSIDESAFGPNDSRLASVLNRLGAVSFSKNNLSTAQKLFERGLNTGESGSNRENADVASSLDGLARVYAAQGQYTQAEPAYKRALAIREKILADDDLDLADTVAGYATLLNKTGRRLDSEDMQARAEGIRYVHGVNREVFVSPLHRAGCQGMEIAPPLRFARVLGSSTTSEVRQIRRRVHITPSRSITHGRVLCGRSLKAQRWREPGVRLSSAPRVAAEPPRRVSELAPTVPHSDHTFMP